jgi:hypothetical protein
MHVPVHPVHFTKSTNSELYSQSIQLSFPQPSELLCLCNLLYSKMHPSVFPLPLVKITDWLFWIMALNLDLLDVSADWIQIMHFVQEYLRKWAANLSLYAIKWCPILILICWYCSLAPILVFYAQINHRSTETGLPTPRSGWTSEGLGITCLHLLCLLWCQSMFCPLFVGNCTGGNGSWFTEME